VSADALNSRWLLAAFPRGRIQPGDFQWSQIPLPEPGDGQVLVRNIYLSLDPTNRLWASGRTSYLPALKLGDVMRGITLGVVSASRDPKFAVGDYVTGALGWQSYALARGGELARLPRAGRLPLTAYLSVLGSSGLTAYFGLLEIGKACAGETVLVSAAAGSVGSLVAQIAKAQGCHVVGIAGSDDKCRWLREELRIDAAINYRTQALAEAIARHCPGGVDVYFDNVGGETLDAAMGAIALRGRIVLCGLISQYNDERPQQLLTNLGRFLVQRGRMEAFIVIDYLPRAREAHAALSKWLQAGQLHYRVDVVAGLEQAPAALERLFTGTNQGKQLVQISAESLAGA